MLNIDDIQQIQNTLPDDLIELLKSANLIEADPEFYLQGNQIFSQILPAKKQFILTSEGFNFVLLDTPQQVHMILKKLVELVFSKYRQSIVEVLQLVFNLLLAKFNQTYKIRRSKESQDAHEAQSLVKTIIEAVGLVDFEDKERFRITKLMQAFLLTQKGIEGEGLQMFKDAKKDDKFIIVETNFRVWAYTQNKMFREILKLFMEPDTEFPNMLYGQLTKKSVEKAFKQKITSR